MTDAALATLREHLLQALDNPPGTETRRLFHGRGRCWPGLEQITVDWLSGIVLVMLFREPSPALRPLLLELLATPQWQASGARRMLLQHRYVQGSESEWLVGETQTPRPTTVVGLHYLLDL